MEFDALVVLWRRVSQEWSRALEMLRVMISKGYCLARRDQSINQIHIFQIIKATVFNQKL